MRNLFVQFFIQNKKDILFKLSLIFVETISKVLYNLFFFRNISNVTHLNKNILSKGLFSTQYSTVKPCVRHKNSGVKRLAIHELIFK